MAIQKNYNKFIYGQTLTFSTAYHKITSISGNKDSMLIRITVYTDNTKEYVIDNKEYYFTPSVAGGSANFMQQGYDYLKTLDEYKDAVDLLDEGQTF